jgi:hypothetical protein
LLVYHQRWRYLQRFLYKRWRADSQNLLQLCWVGLAEWFSETICNAPGQTFLLKNANAGGFFAPLGTAPLRALMENEGTTATVVATRRFPALDRAEAATCLSTRMAADSNWQPLGY